MSEQITAEARGDFGKGAARRLRREGKVPAVVYGAGLEQTLHISVDAHDAAMAIRRGGKEASLTLVVDGAKHTVKPQQIQVDPVRRSLEHIDFFITEG